MKDEKPYHHGDLRSALLAAAEAELTLRGIEGFSLRAVAKRAGVSHAAPAHHFGDVAGLMTALAAEGYRQLLAAQGRREALAAPDARAQLKAAGLGYLDFAMTRTALFRLVFASGRADHAAPELYEAGFVAYRHLVDQVAAAGGDEEAALRVWALTHGLADLLTGGRISRIAGQTGAARDAAFLALLEPVLPDA